MLTIPVYKLKDYESVGQAELPEGFAKIVPSKGLLHRGIIHYLANQREGNADTKTRGEVRGGGRKPWRQKGTGRARHGTIRSPIWRGGGIVFGPHPRDFSQKLNKKEKKLAFYHSLTDKLNNKHFTVIDKVDTSLDKTKDFNSILADFYQNLLIKEDILASFKNELKLLWEKYELPEELKGELEIVLQKYPLPFQKKIKARAVLKKWKDKKLSFALRDLNVLFRTYFFEKILFVVTREEFSVERIARNIRNIGVIEVRELNIYDVVYHEHLVVTKDALAVLGGNL